MQVAALFVYPVKACASVALDSALVTPLGLEHDRRFALVGADGRALTQREQPLLATLRPILTQENLSVDLGGLAQVSVAFADFVEPVSVDVWGTRIPARAVREPLTTAVSDYVGVGLRLVRLDATAERSFADSRPVLVTTSAMLAALNSALEKPVGMERFRPNVVLEGEIGGRALRAREVRLEYEKPCGRCEVTTIDQESGARRGPEPLATLTERFDGEFGRYYRIARPGRLRRGEEMDQD